MVLPHDLYPVAPGDALDEQPNKLQLLTNIEHQLAVHVESLPLAAAAAIKQTIEAYLTPNFDRVTGGRHKHDSRQAHINDNPLEYIDPT
jgi:hypothetical protein